MSCCCVRCVEKEQALRFHFQSVGRELKFTELSGSILIASSFCNLLVKSLPSELPAGLFERDKDCCPEVYAAHNHTRSGAKQATAMTYCAFTRCWNSWKNEFPPWKINQLKSAQQLVKSASKHMNMPHLEQRLHNTSTG